MTDRKSFRLFAAVAIGLASLPISLISVDSFFGLGSFLIVPACAASVLLMLSAADGRRAWWFGMAFVVAFCLPLCPLVETWLHGIAVYFQRLSQRGVLSLSQWAIEPTLIIMVMIVPLLIACLLGIGVGALSQRLLRGRNRSDSSHSTVNARWRFSIREMLVAFVAMSFLAAWISSRTHEWTGIDKEKQIAFLDRFEVSFSSGQVELTAKPRIEEQQRSRMREYGPFAFRAPGINEYRIVAPIKVNGKEVWSVWTYTCNGDAYDCIYKYAYAEAPDKEQLPQFPFPAQRYIDITGSMVDGVPSTAGPSATLTLVTSPASVDRPVVLTASAPPGTVCELRTFPSDLLPQMPPQRPDKTGMVSWSWNVLPGLAGHSISYEIRCIEMRGSGQMLNSTRGSIALVAPVPAK